ncbi:MAG: T9SS type A sorting domain-containing protein, partial [Prevotellaceae bacterium]|nr:T9SS type A sorting domain-containing protein [Prevotellaceae bacterium]
GGEPYSDGVWTFDWINYRKSDYTYNEQGQQQLTVTSQWIDGAWVETSRTTYYYSDHEVTSSATVAVSDYQVKINAYPNPAQDNLAVSGTQAGQTVRITNMSGQQIGAYTASEGETHINLSTLAKGIYIVSVDDFSVKIIRE